jgi:hypothetical protein
VDLFAAFVKQASNLGWVFLTTASSAVRARDPLAVGTSNLPRLRCRCRARNHTAADDDHQRELVHGVGMPPHAIAINGEEACCMK